MDGAQSAHAAAAVAAASGAATSGRVWCLEQPAATPFSPGDRNRLIGVDVVLYDRALKLLIGDMLPLSTYAEPLSPQNAAAGVGTTPCRRALGFAADGWNVAQVVAAAPGPVATMDRPRPPAASDANGAVAAAAIPAPIGRAWPVTSGLLFTANGLAG